MKDFKFSVVMAAYNTEQFLAEAIDSLLEQDIGFEENIQLILVDDGSIDNTGQICDAYANRYPDNILVIHKRNSGVAAARNAGLERAGGKYVNFLDSDDKLSANAMSETWQFFEKHPEECDIMSLPVEFFDGMTGQHMLNYKYERGTRVIDLEEEYDMIQLHVSSSFFHRDSIKEVRFDERLSFAEDAKFCIQVLLGKMKLGVLTEAKYLYRKRQRGQRSAIQQSEKLLSWYFPTLQYFSAEVLQMSRNIGGRVPRFVQFTVMYDLQWKFKRSLQDTEKVLGQESAEQFCKLCFACLQDIDDEVILGQKQIYASHKMMLLSRKHGEAPLAVKEADDIIIKCHGHEMGRLSTCAAKWEFLRVEKDTLYLEGYAGCLGILDMENVEVWLGINDEPLQRCEEDITDIWRVEGSEVMGEYIFPAVTFRLRLENLSRYKDFSLRLYTRYKGVMVERRKMMHGLYFPIIDTFPHAYANLSGWLVSTKGVSLQFEKESCWPSLKKELSFWSDIWNSGRKGRASSLLYRGAYWLLKPFVPKDIWLISDRINKADDNGEAFFRYLHESGKKEHAYFVLRKDSRDYPRIRKYGRVLDYRSWQHKLLHLLSEHIISSAADAYVMNPFLGREPFFWDILKQKRQVFLQHGITMNDLSGWLGRYKKNLGLFVTSARPEYEFILSRKFSYDGSVAKLTGFARYDYLEDKDSKQVTIMPTWRSSLGDSSTYSRDGLEKYGDSFEQSEYFKFYNSLLNHPTLLEKAKEYGYKLVFMPHPNIMPVIDRFVRSESVEFCSLETRYRDIFARSSLVVTDYSSIAFDFAYLEKPVVYCQFDKQEFFKNHILSQGYFDYERDGFGEVEYNLESTVARIVEYMKSGCNMKDNYRGMVRNFFAYHDKSNSERIYEAIIGNKN